MKLPVLLFLALCATMASASNNPACILNCQNEGKCQMGRAEFGYASEIDEEDETPFSDRDPSTEVYCSCPEGFTGVSCEIVLMPCEENTCSNGEECVDTQNDQGGLYQHCECDAENTDFSAAYSTFFCRQIGTSYCIAHPENSGVAGRNHFCTNGGRCKDIFGPTEQHPGCACGDAWEGPHCEFFKSKAVSMDGAAASGGGERSGNALAYSLLGVICAVAALAVVAIVISRRSKRMESEVELNDYGVGGLDDPRAANQYKTQQFPDALHADRFT